MGLRRLLTGGPAENPIERLAELGRNLDPPRQFRQLNAEEQVPAISAVAVEKRPESGRPVIEQEGRRPNYVWLSERSRRARTDWADVLVVPSEPTCAAGGRRDARLGQCSGMSPESGAA